MMDNNTKVDRYVAIDCESVRTRSGHALARIGAVNHKGDVLLDSYVLVHPDNVLDYNTFVNGITREHLVGAPTFETLQPKIQALLKDKIIVGHAVYNDLAYIQHRHPYEDVRDTSLFYPLREKAGVSREGDYPGFKKLYKVVFGEDIQVHSHCPVEDARATMRLFMSVREDFETKLAGDEDCVAGIPGFYEKWYW